MKRPSFVWTAFLFLTAIGVGLPTFVDAQELSAENNHIVHSFTRTQLTDVYFSEGASAGDINGDRVADVVYGPYWFEGPDYETKHEIYPAMPQNRNGYADNFFCWGHDFDGDGNNDILTVGFPGRPGYVYRNPGPQNLDRLWEKFDVVDSVANESPQFTDVTGDGIKELVCTRHGHYGFATPTDGRPFEKWTFHEISPDVAPKPFGHGLGVGDVNGDGRPDIIARDGWFQQPRVYEPNDHWQFHKAAFCPGGADIFAYDVDGDGDNDVITSLSAHTYGLAWHENIPDEDGRIRFEQHVIMGITAADNAYGVLFTEPHAVKLADINGDGLLDIVTGKTYWSHHAQSPMWDAGAVVYWFELHRTAVAGKKAAESTENGTVAVDWIPHKADGESGIGRGLFVGDINDDGLPDIVTGGMKGAHVLTHVRREVSHEEFERNQPRKRMAMAEGLAPKAAAAQMTVPPGFKVQLAAGEPMICQPIAMCFDHKGRLWVAEAHTYPVRAPDGQGKDRIVIFEDENHDGVFDTSKTFIEGLNLVSGLQVGFGGVYVGAAPYLMFIPDRNGDDVPDGNAAVLHNADVVQFPNDVPAGATVLRDGFGWHDTHETLNAFVWGPDGWLYGCHGVFTHSKVGRPGATDEQRQGLNAGVWRYHPTKDVFEVFAHGTSNPWGVDFNDNGQAFITACVIPHLWHMVQGGRYHRQGGQHFNAHTYDDIKTIADHAHYVGNIRDHAWWGHEPKVAGGTAEAGGGHAHAGAMIYLGDNWPDKYRNQIFFSNIHGNRINNDLLEPVEGRSGYVGHHGDDFLFANDRYYRGINLRCGPDGSVYLIDWYDKNACHRRDPEIWDRSNGRIYRISYGTPDQKIALDTSQWTAEQLLAAHEHRNDWHVRMARKRLMEIGPSPQVVDSLWAAAADTTRTVDRRLRYLWTLHALDGLHETQAIQLLKDSEEYIRAWTIQLTLEDRKASSEVQTAMTSLATSDPSAVVRMYLASALQRLPLQQRWSLATALAGRAEDVDDHNIPLLLWYGIEPLVPTDANRATALALQTKFPLLRRYIFRRASAQQDTIAPVVATLDRAEDTEIQQLILDEMLAAFEGRVDIPMPGAWQTAYTKLSRADDQVLRDKADQLAIIFGDQRVLAPMRKLLGNPKQDIKRRQQALDVLVRAQDSEAGLVLLKDSVLNNAQLQGAAIRALGALGNDSVPGILLSRYDSFPPAARADAISTFVSRPTWTTQLLTSIGKHQIPAGDLHAYHVRQILAFKNSSLSDLLRKHWGDIRESSADRKVQIAQWKKTLNPKFLAAAHLGNGRRVYMKTCQNCHRLLGTGGDIGPDITGSNRANLDYILDNILDPSAVVGRTYQMTVVALLNGQVVSGLLKLETDSALTIQTINDKVVVAKSQIEERTLSKVSMMPERQLDSLAKEDARDLIAYLASPRQVAPSGPPSPIDAATGKVPEALEGESLKIVEKTAGKVQSQPMGGFKAGRWSGADHLWWTGAKPGDRLALAIPVAADGTYAVEVVFTKARDYGIVKLSIDDRVIDPALDLYSVPDVTTTGVLSYPGVTLSAGEHRLSLEITGAHPRAAKSYMVGVDYIRLVPVSEQ
ncbi:MAG: PVC-type heme-binding CxxCH protein [Fuerstiella sp.]